MIDTRCTVGELFAALEGLISAADPTKLAAVPAINLHVVGASPSRWSLAANRSPRLATGFENAAGTLISCDEAGLRDLLRVPRSRPRGTVRVVGDPVALEALSQALERPLSWLEARSGR